MDRFAAQLSLFAEIPSRRALCETALDQQGVHQKFRVNVWRNHAFELIASLITPFAAFGRFQFEWRLSDYDDAFSFCGHTPADLELVWLDRRHYGKLSSTKESNAWLNARMCALRRLSSAPIVLISWTDDEHPSLPAFEELPAVHVADLAVIARETGLPLVDSRTAEVAGTPVRSSLHSLIARELAGHWLASAVLPPLKAIVLDLDGTLHAGVVGEEGPRGVVLTPGHIGLQRLIKELGQRGVFLALVSHNDERDVHELFAVREDYPLRLEDFTATELSWQKKASAIVHVADRLRIGIDAVLFVDDSWGEVASVLHQLPTIHTVWAQADATLTARAINYYPGLWRWNRSVADALRQRDIQSTAERIEHLEKSTDTSEYLRGLDVCLSYRVDPSDQRNRLAELCRKTNQFNLSLRRLSEADFAERLSDSNASIVSVELTDRLSASGLIAVVVGVRRGAQLEIEEISISCRALGRALEDTIVLEAIRQMPVFIGCEQVTFRVAIGQRNEPALIWLTRLLNLSAPLTAGHYNLAADRVRACSPQDGVNIQRG